MYLGNRSNAKCITCKSNLKASESLLESIGAEMVDWAEGGKTNSLFLSAANISQVSPPWPQCVADFMLKWFILHIDNGLLNLTPACNNYHWWKKKKSQYTQTGFFYFLGKCLIRKFWLGVVKKSTLWERNSFEKTFASNVTQIGGDIHIPLI